MTKTTLTLDLGADWMKRLETLAAQAAHEDDIAEFARIILTGNIQAMEAREKAEIEAIIKDYESDPDSFGSGLKDDGKPLNLDLKDGIPL
jgi:uncharacterized protein YihD (DUF1040 family)